MRFIAKNNMLSLFYFDTISKINRQMKHSFVCINSWIRLCYILAIPSPVMLIYLQTI
jgi:hypothetical protein